MLLGSKHTSSRQGAADVITCIKCKQQIPEDVEVRPACGLRLEDSSWIPLAALIFGIIVAVYLVGFAVVWMMLNAVSGFGAVLSDRFHLPLS